MLGGWYYPIVVTAILCLRASWAQVSCSSKSDLPASKASAVIRAAAQVSSVCGPRQGMSKRRSCFSLATLTAMAPPPGPASAPPRARHGSVPSKASTASTVPSLTRTVCPISRRETSLAMQKPKSTSACCAADSFGPSWKPLPGIKGFNHGVASISSTPSRFSSSAIAPKTVWAFFSRKRNSSARARKSGRISNRQIGTRRSLDQLNALALQLVGNRAEDRVGILFPQAQQQREGAEIGSNIKQALGGDLAGHDAVLDAAVGEGGQHLGKLADLEPDDFVH